MPWEPITLNDGHTMPGITATMEGITPGRTVAVEEIRDALDSGFVHIHISGNFTNLVEPKKPVARNIFGRDRSSFFITTQWNRLRYPDGAKILRKTLNELGLDYADLFLLNDPYIGKKNIAGAWADMEKLKEDGLTKSIGVVNFDTGRIRELVVSSKTMPAVNKIEYNPSSGQKEVDIVELCQKLGIVILAHNIFLPMVGQTGGKLLSNKLEQIARRLDTSPALIPLVWAKCKNLVPTLSLDDRKKLKGNMNVSNLALTTVDLAIIDIIGADRESRIEEDAERTTSVLAFFVPCFSGGD